MTGNQLWGVCGISLTAQPLSSQTKVSRKTKLQTTLCLFGYKTKIFLFQNNPIQDRSIFLLTSSLKGQLDKCFTTLQPKTLIFFVEKMREYWHIWDINVWNFNEALTNNVISFEQPGPGVILGQEILSYNSIYSRTSMARTPLEPWKYVQDRGSSSLWVLIIALDQEA